MKGEEKIIARTPLFHGGQHVLTHSVEGGTMLWMPRRKATYSHWEALHVLPKKHGRLPLACTCYATCTSYFFF